MHYFYYSIFLTLALLPFDGANLRCICVDCAISL